MLQNQLADINFLASNEFVLSSIPVQYNFGFMTNHSGAMIDVWQIPYRIEVVQQTNFINPFRRPESQIWRRGRHHFQQRLKRFCIETMNPFVTANGKSIEAKLPSSIEEFLLTQKLLPRSVVVEHNGEAVAPSEFSRRQLHAGDKLEIVKIVAGG